MTRLKTVLLLSSLFIVTLAARASPLQGTAPPMLERGRVVLTNWLDAGLQGDARLGVMVKDGVPMDLTVASSDNAIIGPMAVDLIKAWRFAPGSEGQLAVRVRYTLDFQNARCTFVRNLTALIKVPTDVELSIPPQRRCESIAVEDTRIVVRDLDGQIRCDCKAARPIAGASIEVQPESYDIGARTRWRTIHTAADGTFRLDNLPDGIYLVTVSAAGFAVRNFRIRVLHAAPIADFLDWRLPEAPELWPTPPATVVREADIPLYPEAARTGGIEGVVKVKITVSPDGTRDIDADSELPVLSQAAIDNVRTWVLSSTTVPAVHVTFTYKLLPGDCTADQQPMVIMRFPQEVEITAKRPVKCGT